MTTPRVVLVHWNPENVAAITERINQARGQVVGVETDDAAKASTKIEALQPHILVLSVSFRRSHSRMLAAAIRSKRGRTNLTILLLEDGPTTLSADERQSFAQAIPDAILVTPQTLGPWVERVGRLLLKPAPAH